jgi:hypothetical protein
MSDLKAYHELACENLDVISAKVLDFIGQELASGQTGWIFLNTKNLLLAVPELTTFFKKLKLYPMEASITILYDDLPIHVDTLPIVAKINIPIQNTKGWVNRWYQIDKEILNNCPDIVDHLGFTKKDVSGEIDDMTLTAEIFDQSKVIVFNSAYPHAVIKIDPIVTPRVILSVTFHNEPVDLLK